MRHEDERERERAKCEKVPQSDEILLRKHQQQTERKSKSALVCASAVGVTKPQMAIAAQIGGGLSVPVLPQCSPHTQSPFSPKLVLFSV